MNGLVSMIAASMVAATAAGALSARAVADTGRTVIHTLGFAVVVGEQAAVDVTADGFHILPEGEVDVRSPPTVWVRYLGADAPAPEPLDRTRTAAGVTATFGVETVTVGSGGTEYTLIAQRPLCDGILEIEHHEQCEFCGEPDFDAGWQILDSATCQPSDD